MDEFSFLRNAFRRLREAHQYEEDLKKHVELLPKKQQFMTDNYPLAIEYMIREYLEMKSEKTRGRG